MWFKRVLDLSYFVPPPSPKYVMRPPVTEHVPLRSKSVSINQARASGGANIKRRQKHT